MAEKLSEQSILKLDVLNYCKTLLENLHEKLSSEDYNEIAIKLSVLVKNKQKEKRGNEKKKRKLRVRQ